MIEPTSISFTNPDQSTNTLKFFDSKSSTDNIILVFPAMGVKASYYDKFATALAKKGTTGVTCDLRGNGLSSIRPSKKIDFGYREIIDLDYHSAITKVIEMYPNKNIYLLGHSLGGQLAALYLSKYSSKIKGLILIASCSVYYKAWGKLAIFSILPLTQFFALVSKTIGYFPGKRFGFGGLEAKTVMNDWAYQARVGNYVVQNDAFDYESNLQKINISTLAISFDKDRYAPHAAVKNLYTKLSPSSDITHLKQLDSSTHGKVYNHFNWAKYPDDIVSTVIEWIKK